MGWNTKTFRPVTYAVSWKDYVRDEKVDAFERYIDQQAQLFISEAFEKFFEEEIKTREVVLT